MLNVYQVIKVIVMLLMIVSVTSCKDSEEKNKLLTIDNETDEVYFYCVEKYDEESECSLYQVNIYALLSNLKSFKGKNIRTCGYLYAYMDSIENPNNTTYILYPNEPDFLNKMYINALRINTANDGAKLFRHMEIPYDLPVCLKGVVAFGIGHRLIPDGIENVDIYTLPYYKDMRKLHFLNGKLDSLLIKNYHRKDFLDFPEMNISDSPFEIHGRKIRLTTATRSSTVASSDCPQVKKRH